MTLLTAWPNSAVATLNHAHSRCLKKANCSKDDPRTYHPYHAPPHTATLVTPEDLKYACWNFWLQNGLIIGNFKDLLCSECRSQWPRGLRRRSTAVRLLRSWVRIPPGAWMLVCCVLSGRGLCDELITRPEESYRLWCVVCDLETTKILVNEEARPTRGLSRQDREKK